MPNTKIILTDIEGTTSSLSFVKDVLFPYASQHLESFIGKNKHSPEIIKILYEVIDLQATELSPLTIEQEKKATDILQTCIKLDLKIKALKDLQGLIWEDGYKNQDFYGHIYDDAYEKLKEWHRQGIKLYVYSSGSVYAQKLLFGHTKFGDLNYLFSGNFDTSIGHKRETSSYINIIQAINQNSEIIYDPDNILFLSDIDEELAAAASTGMNVIKINRDHPIDLGKFTEIKLI